jgi:hypothetical protein
MSGGCINTHMGVYTHLFLYQASTAEVAARLSLGQKGQRLHPANKPWQPLIQQHVEVPRVQTTLWIHIAGGRYEGRVDAGKQLQRVVPHFPAWGQGAGSCFLGRYVDWQAAYLLQEW